MKKTLTLCENESNYEIKDGSTVLISFDRSNKTVKGKDIFDKIYINCDKKEKVEITIKKDASLKSQDDEIVCNRLADLFKEIDKSVNNTLFPDVAKADTPKRTKQF